MVKDFPNTVIGLAILIIFGAWTPLAFADDLTKANSTEQKREPVGEYFTGGALTKNSWISWVGAVKSLSSSLYQDGWRIRLLGAYGQYGFLTSGQSNFANPALLEITPGYQFKTGPLISKVLIGLHGEHHKLANPDPANKVKGMGYGAKLISENWIDLPMNSFASLDASYSTLNVSYQGMLRTGSAFYWSRLTLGPELQVLGNEEFYQLRAGLFARWKTETGSLEASGGYAQDYDEKSSPYASFSWLRRF